MRVIIEKLFPSLGKKIALAVILVFLVVGSVFVYFARQTGYAMLRKQAQAKAHGIAEFGKSILEYIMLSGKNDQLQAALERTVASGEARDILILKEDGTIVLKANGDQYPERLPLKQFIAIPQYSNDKFLSLEQNNSLYEFVITPIVNKPECHSCHPKTGRTHGYLAVKISMDDVRATSLEHRTMNIVMTIITFIGLGGILYITLMFLITRPVKKLNNQMVYVEKQIKRYEEGEQVQFSELDNPRSQDEIANLIRAYNKLIQRLNDAHAKLHEMHQSQLEQADRLATTGEMAASMAHEIKNPIAGVLGALQVFDSETPKEDDRKEIIAEMIIQLERVNNAVNDLLCYARPTDPLFEEVLVDELITKTSTLLSRQFKEKNIQVQTQLPVGQLIISADKKQIQQVLWNIMLNAVQSMDKDGNLTISLTPENSMVKIQIADTGKGIYPEQLEQVFKPFFTTKHKGTGLGMTISKRIIEQHKGKIHIHSVVGKGTIVTLSLPLKQD
ncbi:MAG: ATP-binding protein [Bacteroidota bacterium]|nr:ATP-binding protein [Bacteroidota bacterium]